MDVYDGEFSIVMLLLSAGLSIFLLVSNLSAHAGMPGACAISGQVPRHVNEKGISTPAEQIDSHLITARMKSGIFVMLGSRGVLRNFREGAAGGFDKTKQTESGAKRRTFLATECKARRKERQSDAKGSSRSIELLFTKARAAGSVSIVVGLCIQFVPEGNLINHRAVQAQRQTIALAQSKLLRRLTAYEVTSVRRYEFIPYIAMQVDVAALTALKGSLQVASIEEDIPKSPAN